MALRRIRKTGPILPRVLDALRNAIVQGDLEPGERLNESSIASKLGVSRSPVREAIKVLESENLVQTFSGRGAFVKELSEKEIEDFYMVLEVVHSPAVRMAAEKMNSKKEKDLKTLMNQIARDHETDDTEKRRLLAHRFHRFIVEATENGLLLKIYDSLRVQEERLRYYALKAGPDRIAEANAEHLAIGEALLNRDPALAELMITNHFNSARFRVLQNIQEHGEANASS